MPVENVKSSNDKDDKGQESNTLRLVTAVNMNERCLKKIQNLRCDYISLVVLKQTFLHRFVA